MLRKRYTKGKNWSKLPIAIRTQVKSIILAGLVRESEKIVKNSIAQLIGAIVKHELQNNSWPEIFQLIQQLVSSENMTEKELGMYTLSIMTEITPEVYVAHAQSLMSLLVQTYNSLQQQYGNSIAYYIVKTMQHLTPLVENNQVMVNAYHQMIPMAILTMQSLVEINSDKAIDAMELFDELCESAVTVISLHVKNIIPMCLIIGRNKTLDEDLRVKAIELIGCLSRAKTRTLVKHKLVEPIVDVLFEILSTPPEDENEEIYFSADKDEDTAVTCASEVLDVLALNLNPDKLIPHLLKHIEPSFRGNEIYAKKASLLSIAVLAEGCAEYIRKKYLKDFLCCICQGIGEPSPVVRNAALFALGQFSEHLQPDISEYSSELMPVLIEYLGEMCRLLKQNQLVIPSTARMFYALETFCETLNDALLPYLPTLMEKIFEILESDSSPVQVRELALSAIGASANASKENMLPYFPRIISILDVYMSNQHTDETTCLCVQAVDTLGVLARTIGNDNFLPLVEKSMNIGIKLITDIDDPDMRKASYGLFASLALIVKKDMAPVLPKIIDSIFTSIQSSEGVVTHFRDNDDTVYPICEGFSDCEKENEDEEDIENTDNEEDADDEDDVTGYTVKNSFLEEKEEALLALREIALYTEEAFLPYLEKSFEETFKLICYPQDDVKRASIEALTQFCINLSKINSPEGKEALLKALGVYVPKLSELIRLDEALAIAISGLEALGEMLKEIKHHVVIAEGHKDAIMNCVTDTFSGKIECQDQDEPECEDDDADAEQDDFLFECAGEVLSNFAKAITPDEFAIYFLKTLPLLKEKFKDSKSDAQKSFAVGTIAECMAGLGHNAAAFFPELFMLFKKCIEDSSPEIRNNAYYGMGELVLHAKEAAYPHYNDILQLLAQRFRFEDAAGPRDNMTGVIARLIITNYSLVDLDIVFPAFIQQLPLKEDFEEYKAVFKSVLTLYQTGHEVIKPHIQTLLKIAISVLHEKKTESEGIFIYIYFIFKSIALTVY